MTARDVVRAGGDDGRVPADDRAADAEPGVSRAGGRAHVRLRPALRSRQVAALHGLAHPRGGRALRGGGEDVRGVHRRGASSRVVRQRLAGKPIPMAESWMELAMAQFLYDRGGFWQLKEYEECSFVAVPRRDPEDRQGGGRPPEPGREDRRRAVPVGRLRRREAGAVREVAAHRAALVRATGHAGQPLRDRAGHQEARLRRVHEGLRGRHPAGGEGRRACASRRPQRCAWSCRPTSTGACEMGRIVDLCAEIATEAEEGRGRARALARRLGPLPPGLERRGHRGRAGPRQGQPAPERAGRGRRQPARAAGRGARRLRRRPTPSRRPRPATPRSASRRSPSWRGASTGSRRSSRCSATARLPTARGFDALRAASPITASRPR